MRIAVLDDWQNIARTSADWSALEARADVVFFHDAFISEDAAATALAGFDAIIAMRERTAFPASLVSRLPDLKLFSLTGRRGYTLDFAALQAQGVIVSTAPGLESLVATAELTLALIMASARQIPRAEAALRRGDFQKGTSPGFVLAGRTLGLVGLGKIGSHVAKYGTALGMTVIAWSPNLTQDRATPHGATAVSKADLLAQADVVSIHMALAASTRDLLGAADLAAMKDGAVLINTSRAAIVDQDALVAELHRGRIFAALDVYDQEPLPLGHPLMKAPNTLLTPHLGYGAEEIMRAFYAQSIENVMAFLDGAPMRVMPPQSS